MVVLGLSLWKQQGMWEQWGGILHPGTQAEWAAATAPKMKDARGRLTRSLVIDTFVADTQVSHQFAEAGRPRAEGVMFLQLRQLFPPSVSEITGCVL